MSKNFSYEDALTPPNAGGAFSYEDATGEKPKRTWGEAIKDTGAQLAEGVNTTLGAIPSVVAPQSKAAGFFRDNADYWRDQQSDVLKGRIAETDKRIAEAGKDGVLSQIGTAASEYWNDPAQAARLVATNLPSMAATLGTGAAAGFAAKGVAAARGLDAANKAALAAKYGTTTAYATNAALNAGGARGEAFEDLQKTALAQGMTPEQAEQAGVSGSILPAVLGGVAGAISGKIGLEKALLGQATTGAAMRKAAGAFGAELAGEQIEELTPKVATNYQVGRIDPGRTLTDDLGRTMVETAIGSGPGAVVAGGAAGMRTGELPPSPGAGDPTTSPGAADPNAPVPPGAAPVEAPEAPDLTTSPGAGVARDGMDFTREVDTSGLSLQDPAELERAKAATVDYQPGDTTPQWDTAPGAAPVRSGLDMPAHDFDTGALGFDPRPLSERMGLVPAANTPLTKAAALSVDTGASPVQFLGATGRDVQLRQTGPGVTNESNVIDVDAREVLDQRGIPTARRLTNEQEGGARAAPSQTLALPAPTNLREGLERIRAQRQEAANAQATAPEAAPSAQSVPAAGTGAVEAAGVKTGGFDSAAFDNARANTIKASKAAGNKHLDEVPAYVESMRGKQVYYAHDNKVRGVIRTVDNRGNVYIDWADSYSAEKEMASPVKDGKKTVMRSSIGPTDLKDYVVGQPKVPAANVQPTTEGANLVPQASQTQQGSAQPTQAGGPQAGAATATAQPSTAGGNRVQAAGLNNGATTQNLGAQAASAAGAQAQAPQTAVARPDGWRKSMLRAAPIARAMGIDPTGKRLAQVVAEIDARDTQTPTTPAPQPAPGPVRLGRNNQPLSEGGKPFKTRKAAGDAKKLQPMMRVVSVEGGYALAEKTPAQLAAEERASRRLRSPSTSAPGEPIPAHAFIAAAGGLNRAAAADLGVEGNPRIGNRTLFAGQGRGLSIEQATQMLIQDGYLSEGALHNDAYALIKTSLTRPQYNADGYERIAEAEAQTHFEDYLAAQEEAAADGNADPFGMADSFTAEELDDVGYTDADPALQAEVAALTAQADAMGIDTYAILDDIARTYANATQNEFNAAARDALAAAIARSNQDGGSAAAQAAPAAEPAADQGLDQPEALELASQTPAEWLADSASERFSVGRSLTKAQRRQVLASLVDAYKAKGAQREFKGLDGNGNERYGYVYSPELFEKSDITGAMIRYYVTLPDGRIAHPSELFPYVSASDVERMALEQDAKRRRLEEFDNAIKPYYSDFDSANLMAVQGQVVIEKNGRFAIIPKRWGAIGRARENGWELASPSGQVSEQSAGTRAVREQQDGLTSYTAEEAAQRQEAAEQAAKAEAAAKRAEDAAAKADEDRKRIAQASVRAADTFELGQDPLDSLTGQGSMFDDAPAQQAPTTAASDDEGRERFTLSIEMFGDVPYRASKPVDAGNGDVVSSRVITTKTKLTAANAQSLGLPKDKGTVYAWRVSVIRRADGAAHSVIEAMATDNGRSPDGEVLAHFKEVENPEAMERIAPAIANAALSDWRAAQPQQTPAATENVAEAIPIFERYDDAMAWMKDRAKSQGLSVIAYRATDEFKNALSPQLQALYAASKSKWDADTAEAGKAMQAAMAQAGIRPGDTVEWVQSGAFLSQDRMSGVVRLDSNGVPQVHMGSEIAVAKPGGKIGYTKKLRWQDYMKKSGEAGKREQNQPEAPAATEPVAQPITRADVTAAKQQAAAIIAERIDAMTAGEVNTIAKKFLPTMGMKPTMSKANNKAAMTDAKINLEAAAAEVGAVLPAEVTRALQADMEGHVVDAAKPAAPAQQEASKPKKLPPFPVDGYRLEGYYANGAKVKPLPAKAFSPTEVQAITDWFKSIGWSVTSGSGANGVNATNDVGMTVDDLPEPYTAAQRKKDEAQKAADERAADKKNAQDDYLASNDAGKFVSDMFGDSMNRFNLTALAKVLAGDEKTFGGLFSNRAADVLADAGISTEGRQVKDVVADIKATFDAAQQDAKNPARAVADGFVEQAAAESDYASTAEQVEAAQELLLPIRQGEMITDDVRQTLESLLKIPSLKGFDQPTARRLLMIAGATKAAIEKVMRTNPVSIDDLATELGKATGEAEKKKAFDRAFNAASQIAQTDQKVKELLDIYNLEKSILDGIASERGLYGVKWAERNVSSRWTGQSQKVRSVKQRLVDAVNKAAPSGVRPTVSKERNKVAVTDFTKVNPMAAAAEFGVTLPADVRRALDAEMQGKVADAGQDDGLAARADGDDDYLRTLFGGSDTAEQDAVSPAQTRKVDAKAAVPMLRALAQEKRVEAEDWSSRKYKGNKSQVNLRGDGPSNQETMSVSAVNESRRRKAVESLVAQANAADKLADRIESGSINIQSALDNISSAVDSDIKRDGGKPSIGKSRQDMFEGYISRQLLADPYAGYGEGTVSSALRAMYEGRVADAQPADAPNPLDYTPKQYADAWLRWSAETNNVPLAEVREMQGDEAGLKAIEQRWVDAVVQEAKSGQPLPAKTLDKLLEVRPNAQLPESAIPDGYQRSQARKQEADEQQARADNRKKVKQGAADNPFADYNALAQQYGYEVRPDGAIGSDGKFPGPTMKVKGGRLRIESGSGDLLASYAGTSPDSLGKFLESFWYAEKKADGFVEQGDAPMFSRTGAKSPNAQQPTARAWYDRFVSLLPASYRNDPHRREPLPAEDWNVQRSAEVREKIDALNKQLRGANDRKGYGPVSADGLGNLQVDARYVSAADLSGPIRALADELGAGVAATNVRSGDVRALMDVGFVPETSLAAIADRLMGRPFAQPVNTYTKDSAPGTILTYKPRGFPAALFSFAGARAATADSSALVTAQDRLNAGEDAEAVRQDTGWFKGTDGKWRFEINDADAKLRPALKSLEGGGYDAKQIASVTYRKREDGTYDVTLNPPSPKQTSDFVTLTGISKGAMRAVLPDSVVASVDRNEGDDDLIGDFEEAKRINVPFEFGGFNALPLDNVIDHPALFAAYPALRDVMVQVDPKLGIGGSFSYVDHNDGTTSKVIRLGSARQLSTLLHEIQHGIQGIEGFASGGSPNEFRDESADAEMLRDGAILAVMMRSQGTIEKAKALFVQRFKREPAFGAESAALSGESPGSLRSRADNALSPQERYRRLAGEVEARNTQARQNLTDAQRRATSPGQTADVADADVVVVFNGKEMANAPMPANAVPDAATTVQPLRTPAATIRAAITKAYGKLLGQLESKGLVTLTQTEDEAIEAAAQARADKTGQSVERERAALRASVKNSVADQTQTEAFKRWFAGSKAVDAEGKPLVVYHGTAADIAEFRVSENGEWGAGIYFTNLPDSASKYADRAGDSANVLPVYASLANPASQKEVSAARAAVQQMIRDGLIYVEQRGAEMQRVLREQGYDGVVVRGRNGNMEVVAFRPEQIKSATGNNGAFDPADPDIRRSADGAIQGFFDPQTGQSFLVADNLTAEAAPGVLMHEVGIHMAADGSMKALFNRAAMMLKLQRGNPFIKAVQARMDAAGETSGEEAAAYIAEAYENDRANAPASVQRWLADLLAAVKAWMFKKGIMGADRLTVADIAAVARANARSMARGDGATGGQGFGTAFSRGANEAMTNNDVVGKQGGRSADDTAPGEFAMAGDMVDGLLVRDEIPNQGSIGSSIDDYTVLRGIREIPLTAFTQLPKLKYYSISEEARTKRLAEQIKASGEINPLIVVIDKEGPYVLEGGHRFDALREIGKTSFPALVVLDNESLNEPTAPDSGGAAFSRTPGDQTQTENFRRWFKGSKVVDSEGKPLVVYHGTSGNEGGDAFTYFDAYASNYGLMGQGAYFTDNPEVASSYTTKGKGETPTVYKVFLSIQNPIDMDAKADPAKWQKQFDGIEDFHEGGETNESWYRAAEDLLRDQGLPMWEGAETMQDGLRAMGFDGITHIGGGRVKSDGVRHRVYIAFEPTQVKSATGNNGNFDPTNPDIRFSRAGVSNTGGQAATGWDAPVQTGFDDVIYKLQDKNIDLKRVVESISKATGKVADSVNAYLKEELFHKRAAKRVADFGDRELKPLMNKMRLAGLSMEDVEEYLHARHAKEANAVIAQRNPGNAGLQDGGSGMTNAAADNYFAKLDPAQRRKLEAVAKSVDAIIEGTRKLYVDYGLEDQAVVDGWASMYQHYIPLMREDKDGGMGTGQGFSVKGKETKGRTGSTRKVVDILANVASQREKLIVRGEKNIVAQALVGLAQANPNPDFWEVRSQAPTERVFDPKTGVVVDRPDPLFKSRENVAVAKVKDANGKVTEQMVVFNEDNPRAVRMAAAMKNLDAGNLEGLLGVSAKITRYFAAINTQYNPVFGVVNLVRDVQGAMVNLGTTPLAGHQGKIAKDTLSALRGIYGDIRKTRKGGQATSQWSQLWEQMQDDGGTTGYRDLFKTSADRANDLKSILNPEGWMDSKWGRFFTADGRLKVPLSMAQKGATEIFGWLSDYNEAMENGVRLAAYKAALDKGMSREQAASLAKNLTVNFNRKGQAGMQAGAVYAFFNAAMQGTARIGQTLFDMDGGDVTTLRLSKTGKAVVYGGVMLGVMQALALSAAGFDDDDPPEFVRERSLIIPTGDKTYVSIPMPLGLHVIPGIGRHATEFALSGFDKPAKRAVSMVGMFADAFNPIGNAGLSMQTIAPTALDPLVALSENKDWTGKPIARVSSNKAMPGHTQWKDTATGFSKVVAEAINWVSGGNEYVAGAFSPTPDQIDYLLAQVGGGVAREAAKVQQTITTAMSGETLPTHKIPLVGRFVGNAASQASQGSAFYANLNKLNELETEIKGLRKDGRFDEASKLTRENPQSILIAMANRAERDVQRLRREKRELIANDASREQVRAKEDQITAVMTRLNEAVERRKAQAAR